MLVVFSLILFLKELLCFDKNELALTLDNTCKLFRLQNEFVFNYIMQLFCAS